MNSRQEKKQHNLEDKLLCKTRRKNRENKEKIRQEFELRDLNKLVNDLQRDTPIS